VTVPCLSHIALRPNTAQAAPTSVKTLVAVPARNEGQGIGTTVRALAVQVDGQGQPLGRYGVVVLVNNSTDDTAEQAHAACVNAPQVSIVTLPPDQANVVGARRAVLDLAAAALGHADQAILVSTDADSVPAPDWLWHLQQAISGGAEVACGRILLGAQERASLPAAVRRVYLQDAAYRLAAEHLTARLNPDPTDPWPRHHQHFGANLALTLRAYRQVGGVPDVPHLEDVALMRNLRRQDVRVRHTPYARVYTSARLTGRVPVGLSTQLAQWHHDPGAWLVPGGPEVAALARAEAALRACWVRRTWSSSIGRQLERLWLAPAPALRSACAAPMLGQGLEEAHGARHWAGVWAGRYPAVPIAQALAEVRGAVRAGQQRA
jgi:hypothetical protein